MKKVERILLIVLTIFLLAALAATVLSVSLSVDVMLTPKDSGELADGLGRAFGIVFLVIFAAAEWMLSLVSVLLSIPLARSGEKKPRTFGIVGIAASIGLALVTTLFFVLSTR
ncbi:MAG: hypothetical protein E7663_02335 [Ruminococcaceae bacterium]|nr:hypothetical protein [Oscillospiraceae bacterium]